MEKFRIEVVREDEYEVEIDETIWTPENLKEWSSVFWDVENTEEFAESVARAIIRQGIDQGFYEGFGNLSIYYKSGHRKTVYGPGYKAIPEAEYAEGIKVFLKYYDDDYNCNTSKL